MTSAPLFQDTSADALALRQRIEAFNADYANAIDADRLDDWPAFFTEAGVYRVVTRENHERGLPLALIYATGRGMLSDRITALRTANIYEPHVYCHQVSATRLLGRDGGGWCAQANFLVVRTMISGPMTVFATGRYHDRFVEVAGALLLAERTCILDSRQIDTLLVVPI
jgi:3-phenylpropionate/cinnamic acid dioxygenase small subunit